MLRWPEPALDIVLWLYRICSLVLGVAAPKSVSWLCFWSVMWVKWGWSTPAGTEATECSSSWAAHVQVCSCVTFHLLCRLSDCTVIDSALIPTFTICMPAVGPGVSCVHAKSLQSCPTLCNPLDCSPPGSSCPWASPGKNTVVGCNFLLQGIFPIQGSNTCLLYCKWILYSLSHLDISWALFSPSHQHRSPEVRSQDCSNHRSGLTMGAKGAAQTLAWSNIHMYMPVKSTAAKARPVSAAGAFIVHSDILQVLSVQSQLLGCKSIVCVAVRKDFISSSLVAWLLGLSCVYGSHL